MADNFLFVDGIGMDSASRRRTRAHVMKGKNSGKTLHRRSRLTAPSKTSGVGSNEDVELEYARSGSLQKAYSEPSNGLGHALLSLALPVQVTADSARAINHFFNSTSERMYPVHLGITIEGAKLMWLRVLFVDEASYHCNVALMHTSNEVFDSNDGCSPKALHYIAQSYPHVQKILNSHEALSDASIAIVLSLICQEMIRNCVDDVAIHFKGLVRMIELRGGLYQLEGNLALLLKICKIDVVSALQNGSEPIFFRDRFPKLQSLNPVQELNASYITRGIFQCDGMLSDLFHDAMSFCDAMEKPSESHMDLLVFEEVVISLCYRVLSFRSLFEVGTIRDASTLPHLGLLLFSMALFLQYRGRQIIDFPILSRCLHDVSKNMPSTQDHEFVLWFSMLGVMWLVGGAERVHLASKLNKAAMELRLESWDDAKKCLHKFPWIDAIHERPGRAFWDQTFQFGILS